MGAPQLLKRYYYWTFMLFSIFLTVTHNAIFDYFLRISSWGCNCWVKERVYLFFFFFFYTVNLVPLMFSWAAVYIVSHWAVKQVSRHAYQVPGNECWSYKRDCSVFANPSQVVGCFCWAHISSLPVIEHSQGKLRFILKCEIKFDSLGDSWQCQVSKLEKLVGKAVGPPGP